MVKKLPVPLARVEVTLVSAKNIIIVALGVKLMPLTFTFVPTGPNSGDKKMGGSAAAPETSGVV